MIKEQKFDLNILDVANVLQILEKNLEETRFTRLDSWDFCHERFVQSRGKMLTDDVKETLALHLMGYLASWGMYRGSSFLLNEQSYLIHKDLVAVLMEEKNMPLFDVEDIDGVKRYLPLIAEVYHEIERYYKKIRRSEKMISSILITKIMLGVYGCVPAYDTNVQNALRQYHIKHTGAIENNLNDLVIALENAQDFYDRIKAEQNRINKAGKSYTMMKTIDTVLWIVGDKKNK